MTGKAFSHWEQGNKRFLRFFCIYAFLFGRMTDRADTNKSRPKGNIGRLEEESREHPTSADNFQCYNSAMFTAWQKCRKIFLPCYPNGLNWQSNKGKNSGKKNAPT